MNSKIDSDLFSQDFISHKSLNYEKYKNKADKRNKILESINHTYSEPWRPKKLLIVLSRGNDKVNVETQESNCQTQFHRKTFSSDDKAILSRGIKQRSRENVYIPSSKHALNLK